MFVNKHFSNFTRIPRIKNAKFSGYYFYINANLQGDFQICISVPTHSVNKGLEEFLKVI